MYDFALESIFEIMLKHTYIVISKRNFNPMCIGKLRVMPEAPVNSILVTLILQLQTSMPFIQKIINHELKTIVLSFHLCIGLTLFLVFYSKKEYCLSFCHFFFSFFLHFHSCIITHAAICYVSLIDQNLVKYLSPGHLVSFCHTWPFNLHLDF